MKNRGITEHPVKRGKAKAIKHFEKFTLTTFQQIHLRGGCCGNDNDGQEPPKTQSNSATVSTQIGA